MYIKILACLSFMLVWLPVGDVLKAGASMFSGYYIGTGIANHPQAVPPFLLGVAFLVASAMGRFPHDPQMAYLPFGTPAMASLWWTACKVATSAAVQGGLPAAIAAAPGVLADRAARATQAFCVVVRFCAIALPAAMVLGLLEIVRLAVKPVVDATKAVVDACRNRVVPVLEAAFRRGGNEEEGAVENPVQVVAVAANAEDNSAASIYASAYRPPRFQLHNNFGHAPFIPFHARGNTNNADATHNEGADGDIEEQEFETYNEDTDSDEFSYHYSEDEDDDEDDEEGFVADEMERSYVAQEVASNIAVEGVARSDDGGEEEDDEQVPKDDESAASDISSPLAARSAPLPLSRPPAGHRIIINNNNIGFTSRPVFQSTSQRTVAAAYTRMENVVAPVPDTTTSAGPMPSSHFSFNNSGPLFSSLAATHSTFNSSHGYAHSNAFAAASSSASAYRFLPPIGSGAPQQQQQQQQYQRMYASQGPGIFAAASASASSASAASNFFGGSEVPTNNGNEDAIPSRSIQWKSATFVHNDSSINNNNDSLGSVIAPAAANLADSTCVAAALLPIGGTQDGIGPHVDDIPNPRKRKTRPEASTTSSKSHQATAKSKASEDEGVDDEDETLEPPAKRHCSSTRSRVSTASSKVSDCAVTPIPPACSTVTSTDAGTLAKAQKQQEEEIDSASKKPAAKELPMSAATKLTDVAVKPAAKKPAAQKPAPKKASKPTVKAPKPSKATVQQGPPSSKKSSVADESDKVLALRRSLRAPRRS